MGSSGNLPGKVYFVKVDFFRLFGHLNTDQNLIDRLKLKKDALIGREESKVSWQKRPCNLRNSVSQDKFKVLKK